MATNLALDDDLIKTAQKLGHHRTKREAVNKALEDYIQHLQQQAILDEFGTIEYETSHDYKKQRKHV